jgi:hypothetical protein
MCTTCYLCISRVEHKVRRTAALSLRSPSRWRPARPHRCRAPATCCSAGITSHRTSAFMKQCGFSEESEKFSTRDETSIVNKHFQVLSDNAGYMRILASASSDASAEGKTSHIAVSRNHVLSTRDERNSMRVPVSSMVLTPSHRTTFRAFSGEANSLNLPGCRCRSNYARTDRFRPRSNSCRSLAARVRGVRPGP